MPTLAITNFNIVCSVLGGFITLFGLVSYLFKEKFYLSEALISLVAGVIFSPHATNFVKPLEYTGSQANLNAVTLYFSRLVLGVQLVLAGVQLPSRYLQLEWKPLTLLLGPVMTSMWVVSSLLIWGMVPNLPFLHALAIAACITPTDPVLSNSIVKGKFADKNVPKDLQKIIIAESGANDGLGYPFLFLALYLIKYTGEGYEGGASKAMGLWFGETWGYTIILSVVYGAAVGWIAKELLHWAEEKKFVDRESFLVFAITLALFIVGTCGMIGSDDVSNSFLLLCLTFLGIGAEAQVQRTLTSKMTFRWHILSGSASNVLACFIAGNAFTWDDWFRLETLDDSLQPTIDMLLNLSIFIWFGAICPWAMFASNNVIPLYRLVFLGILILLLRRLPVVFGLHKFIHQIEEKRQAIFVGFFGPIGVSAIFYLYISLEFLDSIQVNGAVREDAEKLAETMMVVVWFLAICSIVVHGLSIPLGKLGFFLPRTLSRAFTSQSRDEPSFQIGDRTRSVSNSGVLRERRKKRNPSSARQSGTSTPTPSAAASSTRPIYRIGGTIIGESSGGAGAIGSSSPVVLGEMERPSTPIAVATQRTIRFPDDDEAESRK